MEHSTIKITIKKNGTIVREIDISTVPNFDDETIAVLNLDRRTRKKIHLLEPAPVSIEEKIESLLHKMEHRTPIERKFGFGQLIKKHKAICKDLLSSDELTFEIKNFSSWCNTMKTSSDKTLIYRMIGIKNILEREKESPYNEIRQLYYTALTRFMTKHEVTYNPYVEGYLFHHSDFGEMPF